MKDGLIHVCFVLDESGSMASSEGDVKGGFKKVIEEQKSLAKGGCIISLFKFSTNAEEVYLGKNVDDINGDNLDYNPGGLTAMNDGIGLAIDSVGKWLADKDESERPEKNLVVIMTDGAENNSKEFNLEQVREKIKHQTEKYDWSFVYMGTDVSDPTYANTLTTGLKNCTSVFNTRENHAENYSVVLSATKKWRDLSGSSYSVKTSAFYADLDTNAEKVTAEYEKTTGNKVR